MGIFIFFNRQLVSRFLIKNNSRLAFIIALQRAESGNLRTAHRSRQFSSEPILGYVRDGFGLVLVRIGWLPACLYIGLWHSIASHPPVSRMLHFSFFFSFFLVLSFLNRVSMSFSTAGGPFWPTKQTSPLVFFDFILSIFSFFSPFPFHFPFPFPFFLLSLSFSFSFSYFSFAPSLVP